MQSQQYTKCINSIHSGRSLEHMMPRCAFLQRYMFDSIKDFIVAFIYGFFFKILPTIPFTFVSCFEYGVKVLRY